MALDSLGQEGKPWPLKKVLDWTRLYAISFLRGQSSIWRIIIMIIACFWWAL